MALDNGQSYEEINNQINALKTLKESKSNIKNKLNSPTNYDVSSLSSEFPLDKSAVKSYVSSEVKTQIENLINTASNLSSPATLAFFLEKFFRAIKTIKPQLKQIVLECFIKSLGCDYEQTYQAGDVYVRVESIDIKKILLEDPDSDIGKTLYEKTPIDSQNLSQIPRSTNRLLHLCIKNLNATISSPSLLNGLYYGGSGQALFDISYVTSRPSFSNPAVPEYGNFFKVTLIIAYFHR